MFESKHPDTAYKDLDIRFKKELTDLIEKLEHNVVGKFFLQRQKVDEQTLIRCFQVKSITKLCPVPDVLRMSHKENDESILLQYQFSVTGYGELRYQERTPASAIRDLMDSHKLPMNFLDISWKDKSLGDTLLGSCNIYVAEHHLSTDVFNKEITQEEAERICGKLKEIYEHFKFTVESDIKKLMSF